MACKEVLSLLVVAVNEIDVWALDEIVVIWAAIGRELDKTSRVNV